MTEALALDRDASSGVSPRHLAFLLALFGGSATAWHLHAEFPVSVWRELFANSGAHDAHAAVLWYAALPRIAVSLIAGASLGLAGAVMQTVLRNPLAEPTTLGMSAGAALALTAATLWVPGLLAIGREFIAATGSAGAALVVFGLSWRQSLSPLRLVIAGLIVSLYCGALAAILTLFHYDHLQSVFVWGTGSLLQNDWSTTRYLLPRFVMALFVIALLLRPLSVMALEDESARSLGLSLRSIRLVSLGTAIALSAVVVSAVGVVGFVGLAASALAKLSGARTSRQRLFWAPLLGALLLWSADQFVELLGRGFSEIPTGSVTALMGAPLMLWLLPRLKQAIPPSMAADAAQRVPLEWLVLGCLLTLLLLLAWPMFAVGQSPEGWHFTQWTELQNVLSWRWPRFVAAVSAGAMLGIAGTLLQRLTGNPMASPEILGVSSGAALGVIVIVFAVAAPGRPMQICAAAIGAALTLAATFALARKSAFSPERMLLAGVALGSIFTGLVSFLITIGDPRTQLLLSWMAGSTSHVTSDDATIAAFIALTAMALAPLPTRWLAILTTGAANARAVGVDVAKARSILFALTAILTAVPTLLVGPLTFVGLMAPHILRMAGVQRPIPLCLGAAIVGALIMAVADWLGRNLLFPYQIPAGLLATFVGGPYFLWLMRSRAT
ncbi:Fe(3+)-hydroxamate ABC transporter permease FhuB [Methylocapsa sp. S129]|uniref:Fe(3+)-hydroxamate ABC transporter permease FhuB n=1 Tax=Methylocapsa sp. S129 TaxID=1641869 RepID=UPI00131B432D|nr:Fe(3+)-hydroxamate ABC transporter permease FhuB [Methylocapsa sp. S129]